MASVVNDPGGRRRILFVDPNGKRPAIRLGKMSERDANSIARHVEALVTAKRSGQPIRPQTAAWLAEIGADLYEKLAAVGLVVSRESKPKTTLGPFLAEYVAGRANLKPNTKRNYDATRKHLIDYFGEGRPLDDISCGDADDWREALRKRLSAATVSREVKRARQFFRAAVRKRLIGENPFADVKAPAQDNASREFFITADATEKVLDACPDVQWRLIVALSRFGGLRCPSEHLSLTWGDIDWERGRMTVRSPKTEHHAGGESRGVPLFPELRPYLEAAWDEAEPGTTFVVTRYRDRLANLRTQLLRIIGRAGLKPWPRLFHNMRASRQTELTARFPLHVVCEWIGNSAPIADKHYLQVTDAHFADAARLRTVDQGGAESGALAAQNPAQRGHAENRGDSYVQGRTGEKRRENSAEMPVNATESGTSPLGAFRTPVPPRGVEPLFPG